jgi:divalent metal cation (Fe/Co/Zn/Cd) transporter
MPADLGGAPREALLRRASQLALITIAYNVIEGLVSVGLGLEDETISLLGFGLDSFVEVISGVGIWHMIRRLRNAPDLCPDRFEKRALFITGGAFFLLAAALAATAVLNLWRGHAPETTLWGIVISLVSIAVMIWLIRAKTAVGTPLHSEAILADAACSRTCVQLSIALLIASLGYELTGIGGIDSAGALLIAWISIREGREAMQKARKASYTCSCGHQEKPEALP